MSHRFDLSIFIPIKSGTLTAGHHLVHVFTLETAHDLDWVKRNAAELVAQIMPSAKYDALNISPHVDAYV